jgi:predicted RNA methylase
MPKTPNTARVRLGNRRVTGKEQYYTPAQTANDLVALLTKLIPDFANRTVLEPAGGTGAFIEAARAHGASRFVAFDIEPKHPDVLAADFLAQQLQLQGAVALSNPPFGRNNSLSIPFFNHAAAHCDYIAFIVPKSWRKWSVLNRLDRNFHLIADHDLQLDYVDAAGVGLSERKRLATCFQVWQRQSQLRPLVAVTDHGLVTKTTPDLADVALTIFGYGCGTVRTEFERKPNSTRMFLKLNHPDALAALGSVDFSRFYKNTAYTEALSLPEINYLLNEAILGNPHLIEKG